MLCKEGCPLQRTLDDGKARESLVYFRHKLGHRVPVTVRTQPIIDAEGKVVAAFEVFRDASQHKDFQRRIAELESMAFLDTLTRIPNRRYLELRMTRMFAERGESSGDLGLILFDLDQFKIMNDRYGHQAGDAVLKSVARTLSLTLRASDIVGRWGGEEFLAVLPNLCGDALEHLAERCRVLVASTLVPWEGATLRVTTSAGATQVTAQDDIPSAVARVDRLLYESKRDGRNRVTNG
jgi:diguanylate cyclase (GGDEF)-like protein